MSSAQIAFARSADRAITDRPAWPKCTVRDRATMVLDDRPGVVNDPFGESAVWEGIARP
jgi:carboxylesterase type B